MTANVDSTAGNGAFALPQALQANATSAKAAGGGYAQVGGVSSATPLLSYTGPVSNGAVAIGSSSRSRPPTTLTLSTATP
jgi:hypothetical protein